MPPDNKLVKRAEQIFADIEHLASQPLAGDGDMSVAQGTKAFAEDIQPAPQPLDDLQAMRRELEMLGARVLDLEAQLKESEQRASAPTSAVESHPTTSSIYEKERVGYAYSSEHVSPLRMTNAPHLDNAINAPITASGQKIGEMQVKAPAERDWTPEESTLANAVAQQASLQIQNLRLLASAERARSDAQAATRQFTHKSWESFLDGIQQSERIGFMYDQASVAPFSAAPYEHDFQETVNVLDEQVGNLFLKSDPAHPLTEEDKAMVSAVARQISQQVENLRLLADASRARAVAEDATRRMTRDSWKDYAERNEDEIFGFVYDSNQVSALTETPSNISFSQPLMVRGEAIGELAVAGLENISPENAELLAAIAMQTSIHLETLRLTEELQKRAAELQELDRLKSSFLANMSHELRTPLNSILGFSDVMLEGIDGPLTDYMDNDLRLIQKNGQHLLHLINDVLDMAKIESGRMNLHPEKFKVHEVFEEITSITSTLASEKNLSLFIEPNSDKEIEIFADVIRLRQVMINLVNNSIKFTEKGKVTMRVDAQGESHVLITVSDTGLGIPPNQLEIIFQEFSQVDTSTTRKVGGTGLGLPISRRLVEMHGGRLWADSTGISGEGSRFYVELPREAILAEPVEKTAR